MAQDFDAAAHMRAMAGALGLTVTPEQEPGVTQFLDLANRMHGILEQAPVPDGTLELAPVYTPPERHE